MEVVKHSIFPGKEGLADEGVVRLFGYRWSATDCSTVGGLESPSPSISLTLSDEYPLMRKGFVPRPLHLCYTRRQIGKQLFRWWKVRRKPFPIVDVTFNSQIPRS